MRVYVLIVEEPGDYDDYYQRPRSVQGVYTSRELAQEAWDAMEGWPSNTYYKVNSFGNVLAAHYIEEHQLEG